MNYWQEAWRRCASLADRALARTANILIYFYRGALRPWLGGRCRFYPTCSQYAEQALSSYSVGQAVVLIGKRLLRCHPLGGFGFDPLPLGRDSRGDL